VDLELSSGEINSQRRRNSRRTSVSAPAFSYSITFDVPYLLAEPPRSEAEFTSFIYAGPSNLYARTKLAVLLFTKGLVEHVASLSPTSPIKVFATHPGAVSTGQQEQFVPAYGETAGKLMGAAVSWAMRPPSDGAWSLIWTSLSKEAREGDWEQGTCELHLPSSSRNKRRRSKQRDDAQNRELIASSPFSLS